MLGEHKIDIPAITKQYPQWFYFEVDNVANLDLPLPALIDQGFCFLLRQIIVKYSQWDQDPTQYNRLELSFTKIVRAQEYQNEPIYTSLFAAPGNVGVLSNNVPDPVDPARTWLFNATEKKKSLFLNYLYQYNETIMMKARFHNPNIGGRAQIVLIGYYIADEDLKMWGLPK